MNPTNEHREQAREIVRVEQRTGRDCLRCCIAMVTRIDYDDVPDFVASHGESWPTACEAWLSELGMGLLMILSAPAWTPPWLPIIARGPTEMSDQHHFVVVTSESVIDPHPSRRGLKEVEATYAVVNSGSLTNDFISHLARKYSDACVELDEWRIAVGQLVAEKYQALAARTETTTHTVLACKVIETVEAQGRFKNSYKDGERAAYGIAVDNVLAALRDLFRQEGIGPKPGKDIKSGSSENPND